MSGFDWLLLFAVFIIVAIAVIVATDPNGGY